LFVNERRQSAQANDARQRTRLASEPYAGALALHQRIGA
jgi:hypothetical protein